MHQALRRNQPARNPAREGVLQYIKKKRLFLLYAYIFYSHYNMDWTPNMKIDLDPNDSVIKRLWNILKFWNDRD